LIRRRPAVSRTDADGPHPPHRISGIYLQCNICVPFSLRLQMEKIAFSNILLGAEPLRFNR
jgi:hypothetical protein